MADIDKPHIMVFKDCTMMRGFEMTDDNLDMIEEMQDATRIWTHPQFLVSDVCKITGATPKAIEHLVNPKRDLVRLVGPYANPGTGRRRVFSGGQVLMIAAAFAMTRIGFPQRWVRSLADSVERQAINRTGPYGALQTDLIIVTYPLNDSDDWAFDHLFNERTEEPKLPVAFHMLTVDRLIDQVKAQLEAMIADEEVPDFTIPDPKPEPNWFGPNGGQKSWQKDQAGNWLMVGLTLDETKEYMALQGHRLVGDELIYDDAPRLHGEDLERSVFLANKHHSSGFID